MYVNIESFRFPDPGVSFYCLVSVQINSIDCYLPTLSLNVCTIS